MFVLFKYLHILTMFAAVAAAFVPEIWLHIMARRADVAGLRGYLPLTAQVGKVIPVLFVAGLVISTTILMLSIIVIVFLMVAKPGT